MRVLNLTNWDPQYLQQYGLSPIMEFEEAKQKIYWGTYGRPPTFPVRWVKIIDCTTEHLGNILRTQHHIYKQMREVIEDILEKRLRSD